MSYDAVRAAWAALRDAEPAQIDERAMIALAAWRAWVQRRLVFLALRTLVMGGLILGCVIAMQAPLWWAALYLLLPAASLVMLRSSDRRFRARVAAIRAGMGDPDADDD